LQEAKKLLERKVVLATLSSRKQEHIGRMFDELVGSQNWGTLTKIVGSLIGIEAGQKLVNRLIDEPSPDLFVAELQDRIRITPNTDALGKTIGGASAIINALPAMAEYWRGDDGCRAYQIVGTDAMSAFLTKRQVETIEETEPTKKRETIDEMIAEGQIKFNNKATGETMEADIEKMRQAEGLLVLAVVKGMGVITGVKKYETVVTPIVGSAFLYAGRLDENKKDEIAEMMRKDGIGIPSGVRAQDIYASHLMETIYCGNLKGNGEKLILALAGKPLDDVEVVVRRNDDNIRQELATRSIEVDDGILLGNKIDPLTDAGFAMARLGRYLKRIREAGKAEIKTDIKDFRDLQRFVLKFNEDRGISENREIVYEKLKGEICEFDDEVKAYEISPSDHVRANLAREISDVVVFLAKLSNYFKLDLGKFSHEFSTEDLANLNEEASEQNRISEELMRNLSDDIVASEKVVAMVENAFRISKLLGYDLFDIVTRKCQRNADKYDADTMKKLIAAGIKPVLAEACVYSLWDKKVMDELYFIK
jgi:hypothetical protein